MLSYPKAVSFSKSKCIAVLLAAAMLAGCGSDPYTRIEPDPERNRVWLLDGEGVWLYHNRNGKLVQRIALPGWTFAGRQFGCPPSLALDPSGAVFVTSNVLPVLWRIDPARFEVSVLEVALGADRDKDAGFTSLAFAADGTIIAANAMHGTLWRIDMTALTAEKLASSASLRGVCEPGSPAAIASSAGAD